MRFLDAIEGPQERELLVAFFDLTRFHHYCQNHSDLEITEMLDGYYELVGDIVEVAGGSVVKFIGDAGLLAFPDTDVNEGVVALKALKDTGDRWLKSHGVPCEAIIKAHFGSVQCARLGTRSDKRLDLMGLTVNTASLLSSRGIALTPQVFRKLDPATRKLFKKHTPPVTYIPVPERHSG
ncbi:MAG: adenylate/guanylate cyclase domain-containing protein [Candidatus Latescibacteria bacterium]|jgi:class 3 adenylate cyclase|nr:adenylate/guanylate cyclase domain-containing protein [Candidatus Latescibacterota bacterium]